MFRTTLPGLLVTFATTVVAAMCLSFAATVLVMNIAEANGASTVIMDRTQGSYRMVVGIIPARPVVPQTHLAIQVFDISDPRPLRDTEVRMTVATSGPPGSTAFGPQQVLNEQTLRYFEVDVPFAITGPWDVSVTVASERGEETFVLPLDVGEPGASIQWIWITAVLVAIIAVGAWTWLTLRRRQAAG